MIVLFAVLLTIHGAIHLFGFAKAFRLAELPQLTQPVTPFMGVLWLLSAALFVVSSVAVFLWPRWWWAVAGVGLLVSTVAIASSWTDAKAGAVANLVVLIGVIGGFLAEGPLSLRAEYDRDVHALVGRGAAEPLVTDADLATLPAVVQRYLRRVGVVGQPRVRSARIRMTGRIRSAPDSRWMPFTAEQHNTSHPSARLFYMTATMRGVPMQGYHRYARDAATMRIKAAALVTVINASGPEMNRGETVTMLNDLCLLAPPMLLDAGIGWDLVDAHTVQATFTNAGQTVRALLTFDESGDLVDFWSDDRYQSSPDGQTMRLVPWSTPVTQYKTFGRFRLVAGGEARWHDATAVWPYIELTVTDARFNVDSSAP